MVLRRKSLGEIISLLDKRMEKPGIFGLFHIISFLVMIGVIILFFFLFKKNREKRVKITLSIFAGIFIGFEILKQVIFTYQAGYYQWYAFPFQFCSSPNYILPLALLVKHERIKSALYNFLSFYGVLGGLIVMFYPGDVFITTIAINIQTMVHHMSMVIIGFVITFAGKTNFSWRGFLDSIIVFVALIVTALIINTIGRYSGLTFNMFFISPFQMSTLPVFSLIQEKAPYPIFLLSYIFGFSAGALLIKFALQGINKLYNKQVVIIEQTA